MLTLLILIPIIGVLFILILSNNAVPTNLIESVKNTSTIESSSESLTQDNTNKKMREIALIASLLNFFISLFL